MNYNKLSRIFDMANLSPKRTGLQYTVWYGPKEPKHKPRVKVSLDNGKELSIEIDSHKVVGDTDKISKTELNKIFKWLDLNKTILLKYWNEARDGKIDNGDVIDHLKKV